MKAKVKRVERDHDIHKEMLIITFVVEVDQLSLRDETSLTSLENAMVFSGKSNKPVDFHFMTLELVACMHADDLRALQREIEAELEERDRLANALVFPEDT